MVDFKPIEGVSYRHNYPAIFASLAHKGESKRIGVYRDLCREDLFFLLYFVRGLKFINDNYRRASWWVDRCNEVQDGPKTDTLDLWFRTSGKTAIITVTETIQDILNDPNERIAILSYNMKAASKPMVELKYELETNELLKAWFPDILYDNPQKDSPRWTVENGIVVKRSRSAKEATVEAHGLVGSQPTGSHFTKRVYDDVVNEKAVATPGAMETILERFQLSANLGTEYGRWRILGTRYDYADVYGWLEEQAASGEFSITIRKYPGEEEIDGQRVFYCYPEEYFVEKRVEMASSVYSAQILQNPVDPDNLFFKPEHARYWTELPKGYENWPRFLMIDPAGWDERGKLSSRGDSTGFLVVLASPEDFWYIVDAAKGRWTPKQTIDRIFASYDSWRWRKMGIEDEKYGQMLRYQLESEMRERGVPLVVEPLKHGGRSKDFRIEALQPKWENGHILLHPEMKDLRDEFLRYPGWREKNMLDALAYGLDLIPRQRKRLFRFRHRPQPTARSKRGTW